VERTLRSEGRLVEGRSHVSVRTHPVTRQWRCVLPCQMKKEQNDVEFEVGRCAVRFDVLSSGCSGAAHTRLSLLSVNSASSVAARSTAPMTNSIPIAKSFSPMLNPMPLLTLSTSGSA